MAKWNKLWPGDRPDVGNSTAFSAPGPQSVWEGGSGLRDKSETAGRRHQLRNFNSAPGGQPHPPLLDAAEHVLSQRDAKKESNSPVDHSIRLLPPDRYELMISPLRNEGYPWGRLRVNLSRSTKDDPVRVLWNILNLNQARAPEPQANCKAEHSNDYSSYMDIVDFSYLTLCKRDAGFASRVTLSMYSSFCVQLLYLRLNEINAASGKPFDEPTVSFSAGFSVELPDTVGRFLLALGNFWSPDGVFYALAQPQVEDLITNQNGYFGRIDPVTISRYQECPSPLVAWAAVAADVASPHVTFWNLPSLVKPALPPGITVKPTVSCLGWKRSAPPSPEALELYTAQGVSKGKLPKDAFGPFLISPNSLALIAGEIRKVESAANVSVKFGLNPDVGTGTCEQLWCARPDELPTSGTRVTRLRTHVSSPMDVTDINFAGLVCAFKVQRYEGADQQRRFVSCLLYCFAGLGLRDCILSDTLFVDCIVLTMQAPACVAIFP